MLKISRQAYYHWLAEPVPQRDWDDAHAINALRQIHEDDPTLGYRFLTDELGDVGITASENRVWRLCSTAGVFASLLSLLCKWVVPIRASTCRGRSSGKSNSRATRPDEEYRPVMSDTTPATPGPPTTPIPPVTPIPTTPPTGTPSAPATIPPKLPRKAIRRIAALFAVLGIAAAVAFIWILVGHDGDLKAAETISIFLMCPGLVLLGFGVGVHVMETFVPDDEPKPDEITPKANDPKGISEAIATAFKDMNGGKLFMATGLLLMLANAYVAKA